jgi:hypothetical protein
MVAIKSAVFFLFFGHCINFGAFSPGIHSVKKKWNLIEVVTFIKYLDYSIPVSKIKVLTLNHGRMTSNRRSQAIPQLKCVGGTAGCSAFVPQVILLTILNILTKLVYEFFILFPFINKLRLCSARIRDMMELPYSGNVKQTWTMHTDLERLQLFVKDMTILVIIMF